MSPVSPVFLTVVPVQIGLKTQLEWEHPFHRIISLKACIPSSWEIFWFFKHILEPQSYKSRLLKYQTEIVIISLTITLYYRDM